jgi:hypothetical protein
VPEIESHDEYRELRGLLADAEPGPGLRAAQRALQRYRELNPDVDSELAGPEAFSAAEPELRAAADAPGPVVGMSPGDMRYPALNPGSGMPPEGMVALEQSPHFQDQALRIEADETADAAADARADRSAALGPEIAAAEEEFARVSELPAGRQEIARVFPEEDLPVDPQEAVDLSNANETLRKAYQTHLASASKDPTLYAPPEFMPEGDGSLDVLAAQQFFEPGVDEFRSVRGPELAAQGIDPNTLDENSDEYKRYADEKWRQVYARAAALGQPVVRNAFKKAGGLGDEAALRARRAQDTLKAVGYGYLGGLLPGLEDLVFDDPTIYADFQNDLRESAGKPRKEPPVLLEQNAPRAAAARHEVAAIGAGIAGAISPGSAPSRIAQGAYRALAPEGAKLGSRMLAGMFAGGLSGAMGAMGGIGGEMAGDWDEESAAAGEGVSKGALAQVAAGVGGGALGELLERGAKAAMRSLRSPGSRLGEKLGLAEEAGYETSMLSGVKPGKELGQQIDDARARGVRHPYTEMTTDVAERGAQTMHDLQATARRELGDNVEKYYSSTDKKPTTWRKPVELVNRTVEVLRNLRTEKGDIPFDDAANAFRRDLGRMVRARVVPADQAPSLLKAKGNKGIKAYSFEELEALGFKPNEIADIATPDSPEWVKQWRTRIDDIDLMEGDVEGFQIDPLFGITDEVPGMPKFPRQHARNTNARGLEENLPTGKPANKNQPLPSADLPSGSANANAGGGPEARASAETVRVGTEGMDRFNASEPVTILRDFLPADAGGYRVILEPINLSPRKFDELSDALVAKAGLTERQTGKRHPAYKALTDAAFRDRRQFPAHPTYAPAKRSFEIPNERGDIEKVSGWAGLKAKHAATIEGNRNLAEGAGFPADMPARAPTQTRGPQGEELIRPKEVGGKTLPQLSSPEWQRVRNIVANLHGPGNENATVAQTAWDDLARLGGFREELKKVAGTRFGEELRSMSLGIRSSTRLGMAPSFYMGVSDAAKLRADPIARTLAATPNLSRLLQELRAGDDVGSASLAQQVFGMGGGALGARTAEAAKDRDLDEEDIQNLRKLLEAYERTRPN